MITTRSIPAGIILSATIVSVLQAQPAPVAVYLAYGDESACTPETYLTCRVSRLLRATLDGPRTRIDWQRVVPTTANVAQGYVTPDGRFVAWFAVSFASGPNVYLHDVVTGQTTALGPMHNAQMLVGNPVRPELYLFDPTGFFILNPAGMRRIDLPCQPNPNDTLPAVTADGLRASVVVQCAVVPTLRTVVFDTTSGATIATVPAPGVVSADGTEAFTRGGFDNSRLQFIMQRRTLAGDVVAEAPAVGMNLVPDPVTGGVVAWVRDNTSNNVALLDRATLGATWAGRLAISGVSNYSAPVFDPASGLAAAFWDGVDIVDIRAGMPVGRAPLRAAPTAAVMFGPPAPLPPTLQAPVVSANAVQLAWTPGGPPATVSRYVLEVGSGPGQANIFSGLDVGLQTSFAAGGVPSGTYYVRVRAGNYTGLSAMSNEVVVTVP